MNLDPAPLQTDSLDYRIAILEAVRERRHDDALELLQRASVEHPRQPEIAASIHALRTHLQHRYVEALGGAACVLRPDDACPEQEVDEHLVMRLVDGRASVEQIVSASSLGRFRALRALVSLYRDRLVAPVRSSPPPRPSMPVVEVPHFEEHFVRALHLLADGRIDDALHALEECAHEAPDNSLVQASLRAVRALRR